VTIIAALIAAIAALPCLYLGGLGMLALLPYRRATTTEGLPRKTFAVIIPAHNEAPRIAGAVNSVLSQHGHQDVLVIVVADNCTDGTAAIAACAGAAVVERASTTEVGKGYALAAGLEKLPTAVDVVGFMDGDCTMSPNLLSLVEQDIGAGAHAVQCRYEMHSAGDSLSALVRTFALSLVHVVRPLAKERIGASAGLKGSGMFFDRRLIDETGWTAHGLAEDIEQHIEILKAGYRVTYEHDAIVTGDAPQRLADAGTQHERWEAGRLLAARTRGIPLLSIGVQTRSIATTDAAIELLMPPLSIVGVALVTASAFALFIRGSLAIAACLIGWAGLLAYLGAGATRSGLAPASIAKAAVFAPAYVIWKVVVYVRAIVPRPREWNPTRRDS
jgi:cellulose synthase/poly-beta-1,6-N-acetylglucosamine synthase-like glycosyltransferase